MIDALLNAMWAVLALVASLILLFVPGVRVARFMAGDDDRATAVLSVLVSTTIMAGLTAVLLVARAFDPRIVGVVMIVLAALNLPALRAWQRRIAIRRLAVLGWFALALIPWLVATARGDFAPADRLQWYYWDLGRALSDAGFVPQQVQEFGSSVRWLPDYLYFNGISETYSALLFAAGPALAMSVSRIPLALAGMGAIYLVARLWLQPTASLVATAATIGTVFFAAKFNTYKPESLGIVIALLAAWLIISGLRDRRIGWLIVGGVALGIDVSIHTIAATAIGLLLAGACLAEAIARPEGRLRILAGAGMAAGIALAVVVVTGIALQGRPLVLADAFHPVAGATDPTWTYLQYSTGNFSDEAAPSITRHLAAGVTQPWAGVSFTGEHAVSIAWILGLGLALLLLVGERNARQGLFAGILGGATLAGGIAFFALSFHTYVPQHTGLVRFAQYTPMLFGLAAGFSFQGYQAAWERITQGELPARAAIVVGAVAAIWLLPLVSKNFEADVGIEMSGREAIAQVRAYVSPGEVVLSNALTSGTLEFFTDAEVPLEGRQPLIEESDLLNRANALLLAAHSFFVSPSDNAILSELGVRWVLVTDRPAVLGASASLGGDVAAALTSPRLHLVWRGDGVGLFAVDAASP